MKIEKLFPLACLGALLALTGCDKKTADEDEAAPPPVEPRPETAQVPTEAGSPPPAPATPAPVIAPATPEPPQLAPPGTFLLLAKVSVENADGIFGLPPGTEVHLVSPGIYEDAAKHRLTLADNQVTNDLRLAQRIRGADSSVQTALARAAQARAAAEHARLMQRASGPPPAPAVSTTAAPAPPAKPLGSSLGTATINETHDSTKGKVYHDSSGTPYWKDAKGRVRYDF